MATGLAGASGARRTAAFKETMATFLAFTGSARRTAASYDIMAIVLMGACSAMEIAVLRQPNSKPAHAQYPLGPPL